MNNRMPLVLKELRISKNMTQKELSDKINVSQRAYSFYETGAREPDLDTLIKIADVFGVPLDILAGRFIKAQDK